VSAVPAIDRRHSLGGSDVAAALGLDPRKTPLDVWREKLLGADPINSPALRSGKFLEPAVIRRYQAMGMPAVLQVPLSRDGWRSGSVDAMTGEKQNIVVEVKTVSRRVFEADWGDAGTDDVPDRVLCQALWYAELADAEHSEVVAAVLPEDPDEVLGLTADEVAAACEIHVYPIARNREVEAQIVERAWKFWHVNVKQEIPPDRRDLEDTRKLWQRSRAGKYVEADAAAVRLLQALELCKGEASDVKERIDQLQFQIAEILRDNEGLVVRMPGSDTLSPILTWKTTKRDGYTVAPTEFRQFRFTKWWAKLTGAQQ